MAAASVRIYNDGPESVDVMVGGRYRLNLTAGQGTVINTNEALSFKPVRNMTPRERAEHFGLSEKDSQPAQPLYRSAEEQ
jgi:hypothetical protein